ncbi:PIN domain-containing protein [Halorussus salilacus]|uniref:PIN domain-containing protein n=1 Tax=Halorussus salilacus TaxID=2953750 RepID=UPI00209D9DA1|nr:PIN domain-containing protein [Halorussus salilacus]USZ67466.1 PIN domain-containing protein [Halorussus salilacus]
MILDTTFLVDVLNSEDDVAELVADLDASGTSMVAATTVMELWEGIHRADAMEREREAVEELLEGLREVPFDRDCAMKAGEVHADLLSDGRRIDVEDVMIGATALVHDVPVATRNVSHFERIGDLEVVSY